MALFDLLGRNWSMGVLWTLCRSGPATFRELQERCESISPSVLNVRLKELREAQLIERSEEGYRPTRMGEQLYEKLTPLKAWSESWARKLGDA